MKERPILFSAPMVRALLDGTKTKTRRAVKLNAAGRVKAPGSPKNWHPDDPDCAQACPYGQPGDRLWVRETWNWFDPEAIPQARRGMRADFTGRQGERQIEWCAAYSADGPLAYPGYEGRDHWRPSIHMPRWASRITLEIVSVRVERLQDISEADAMAEGCTKNHNGYFWGGPHAVSSLKQMPTATGAYRDLWKSINGPSSWDANPWVWVVEFRRVT